MYTHCKLFAYSISRCLTFLTYPALLKVLILSNQINLDAFPKSVLNAHTLLFLISITIQSSRGPVNTITMHQQLLYKTTVITSVAKQLKPLPPHALVDNKQQLLVCILAGRAIGKCLISVYYKHVYHVVCHKCSVSNETGNAWCRNYI